MVGWLMKWRGLGTKRSWPERVPVSPDSIETIDQPSSAYQTARSITRFSFFLSPKLLFLSKSHICLNFCYLKRVTVIWDLAPCSLVDCNQRVGRTNCHIFRVEEGGGTKLEMEAAGSSETLLQSPRLQVTFRHISLPSSSGQKWPFTEC
jgi:hypothetical protein